MKLYSILSALLLLIAANSAHAEADLSITVSDSQDPVILGATFTYAITITNNGSGLAENVVLNDAVTANGTLQGIAAPEEWQCTSPQPGTSGSITCTREQLDAGKSATITLTIKAASAGMISNTANINSPTIDPNPANNTDYEDTTVVTNPQQPQTQKHN